MSSYADLVIGSSYEDRLLRQPDPCASDPSGLRRLQSEDLRPESPPLPGAHSSRPFEQIQPGPDLPLGPYRVKRHV